MSNGSRRRDELIQHLLRVEMGNDLQEKLVASGIWVYGGVAEREVQTVSRPAKLVDRPGITFGCIEQQPRRSAIADAFKRNRILFDKLHIPK